MIRVRSYSKLNLSLCIQGKRPDGYHELESLIQTISIQDQLTLRPLENPGIVFRCVSPFDSELPLSSENLAYRAAEVFLEKLGGSVRGIEVTLHKVIPVAAGMGGGSSNAAAVLCGMNYLFGNPLTSDALHSLALSLGSDIPFFLQGGLALCKGRGEMIQPISLSTPSWFLILVPHIPIATPWAYQAYDAWAPQNGSSCNGKFHNDLERVVMHYYPEIKALREQMLQSGLEEVRMTGSGSAVFGACDSKEKAITLSRKFQNQRVRALVACPVPVGNEVEVS